MKNHVGLLLIIVLFIVFGNAVSAEYNPVYLKNIGIEDSIYSRVLHETRNIYIEYPENYNPESDRKYPVVYILDGEVLLPAVSIVQSFYSGGFMPEMILVGISNSKNRTRDLTPTVITRKYRMPFREENGKSDLFMQFMKSELIPYIEEKYSVTEYRTLIGHSYGGLFTINTLLDTPQLFANYLAVDPSLDWDDQFTVKKAAKFLESENYKGKSLFISLSCQLHM